MSDVSGYCMIIKKDEQICDYKEWFRIMSRYHLAIWLSFSSSKGSFPSKFSRKFILTVPQSCWSILDYNLSFQIWFYRYWIGFYKRLYTINIEIKYFSHSRVFWIFSEKFVYSFLALDKFFPLNGLLVNVCEENDLSPNSHFVSFSLFRSFRQKETYSQYRNMVRLTKWLKHFSYFYWLVQSSQLLKTT